MSIRTLENRQSVRMLDEMAAHDDHMQRARAALMRMFLSEAMSSDMKADSELQMVPDWKARSLGILNAARPARVGEVLADSLDYSNGPELDDVLSLLVRAASGELIQSQANALLQRMAAKWAEMQVLG